MKKPEITQKHLLIAIVAIGVLLVVMGVVNGIFHLVTDPAVAKYIYYCVVGAVLILYVVSRQIGRKNDKGDDQGKPQP